MIFKDTRKLLIITLALLALSVSAVLSGDKVPNAQAEETEPLTITDESLFETEYVDNLLTITGFHQPESGNNLTQIVVPAAINGQKIRAIGSRAFANAGTNIHNLYLPDTLEKINDEAFCSCTLLQIGSYTYDIIGETFATVESASAEIPFVETPTIDASSLKKTESQLPSSLKVIGQKAFYESSVNNIIINSQDLIIGEEAFASTGNLDSIIVNEGASVIEIKERAFQNSGNLHRFLVNGTVAKIGVRAFEGAGNLNELIVSNTGSISVIEEYAFQNCNNLHIVTLRGSLSSIGKNAFCQCGNMNDLVIDSTTPYTIGEYAFQNNANLHNVTLSNGIETIEKGTFENCTNMEYVYLPDSLKTIEEDAFKNLPNLKEITINENVELAPNAFAGASGSTLGALASTNNASAKALAGVTSTPEPEPVVTTPVLSIAPPPTVPPVTTVKVSAVKLKKAKVNKKKKKVTLTWSKNKKASGYTIYKKVVKKGTKAKKAKKIKFVKVKNVNKKTLKLTLKLAKKSTTWFYVKAFVKTKTGGKTVTTYSKASNTKKVVVK
ncbi:MAG: leucine-rich repeat domain-containing protein [Roseburia sp.]|nr:leucine-rich repeat domain-containing protein [Roseburia sp.]